MTEARWEHAANPEHLRIVGEAVVKRHLRFCEDGETMLKAARWCSPNGNHSLLVPGTSRWKLLRAMAQLFHRRRAETESAHLRRCWCWDAWVGHDEYAKPAIAVLLLLHIALLLATPETPVDLRLSLADGARAEDMDRLREVPESFCSLHPCERFLDDVSYDRFRFWNASPLTLPSLCHMPLCRVPHRCPLAAAHGSHGAVRGCMPMLPPMRGTGESRSAMWRRPRGGATNLPSRDANRPTFER